MMRIIVFLFIILGSCSAVLAQDVQEPLRMALPHFPPYTWMENGQPRGLGVEHVSQVLTRAGIPYTFSATADYSTAYIALKRGHIDGFFLASQNPQRDKLARFSEPLTTNNWSWFFKRGQHLPRDTKAQRAILRVGTYKGTNTHRWLIKNHYRVVGQASDLSGLLHMLASDRINAIFLAETVFWQTLDDLGASREDYIADIEIAKPFGMYVSKIYLERYPDTMDRINQAILTRLEAKP